MRSKSVGSSGRARSTRSLTSTAAMSISVPSTKLIRIRPESAEALAGEGISAEVIDVATLKPLDAETILASVQKTGRCVIVHEAARTAGMGAEIAARLADEGLLSLMAPVKRVTGFDTVMPLPRTEDYYMPNTKRILKCVKELIEYA